MKKLLVAALLAASALPVSASVVTYTDRAAFLAATSGTTTEGFNYGSGIASIGPIAQFGNFAVASSNIYASGGDQSYYAINSSAGLYLQTGGSITTSAPTTALGFDYGDFYANTAILFTTSVGNFQVTSANPATVGTFFGIVSDTAFSSINWSQNFLKLDNISVGAAAVPEPAMLGLFGMGAIGLGLSRRRRAA